ncbi:Alpha subunit of the F1 sector of mitochondrial F1F0 ATP synthase [Elasticomyces elasticus]|nr:Alpha subunit of the F1 sector of mitochondrial F1F0 ATP synthase [Elasticomyces elasticus]
MALHELINEYGKRFVGLDVPDWYMNPNFKLVLGPLEAASICIPTLNFAPGLLDVVQSSTPPSPEFFKTTPKPRGKYWAVYAALLTKDGCEPALCIGSGTDATAGYQSRVADYSNKKHPQLPRYVRILYDKGYDLAHLGLLCWAPLPSPAVVPRTRLRFLAMEGTFTNLFFSAIPTYMDATWADIVPWSRNDVLWRPSNSHSPFTESIVGDLALSAEELLQRDEERRKRQKVHSKKSHEKHAQKAREQYDRERAQDIDAFRAKKRKQAASWDARNKSKVSARGLRFRQKTVAAKRFYCATCDLASPHRGGLAKHKESARHKKKVAAAAIVAHDSAS